MKAIMDNTIPIPIKMKPAIKNIIRESLLDITTINLLMIADD